MNGPPLNDPPLNDPPMNRPLMNDEPEHAFGPPGSRYAAVSRRAFLAGTLSVGAAVAIACSHDDAATFAQGGQGAPTTASTTKPTSAPSTTSTTGTTNTTTAGHASTTPMTAAGQTTTTAPAGAAAGEMSVKFTYTPSSTGGRVNNPYVAVWIEDANGALVDTLGLWYEQGPKGTRYLNELRRWSSVDGSSNTLDTVSSATRTPGDYALVWAGTDSSGKAVASGSYFVCIEAAREHGPYSLIREPFTRSSTPFSTDLPAEGELSNASIAYPAK
jgi:hypothetical protein